MLLVVVLAIVLLRGSVFGAGAKDIQLQACARELAQKPDCYGVSGNIELGNNLPSPLPQACQAYKDAFNPKQFATCGDVFSGIISQQGAGTFPQGTGTPQQGVEITAGGEDNKTSVSGIIASSQSFPIKFSIKFSPGWNLISIPIAFSKTIVCPAFPCPPKLLINVESTTCDKNAVNVWRFDSTRQEYSKIDLLKRFVEVDAQEAYWVFSDAACEATFNGNAPTTLSEWTLHAGWNLVASPNSQTLFDSIKGDCTIESGPWTWDYAALDYVESPSLYPGSGYFVKVTRDCVLASAPAPAGGTPLETTAPGGVETPAPTKPVSTTPLPPGFPPA